MSQLTTAVRWQYSFNLTRKKEKMGLSFKASQIALYFATNATS